MALMATVSNTAGVHSPCSATRKDSPASTTRRWYRWLATPILPYTMLHSPTKKSCRARAGDIPRGRAASAWQMKPTSNASAYFTTTRPTTTISWIRSPPRRVTRAPERSWRVRVRLLTCESFDGRNCSCVLLIQRKEWTVLHVVGIEDRHGAIVQDQPLLFITNGHDCMICLVFVVVHDYKP